MGKKRIKLIDLATEEGEQTKKTPLKKTKPAKVEKPEKTPGVEKPVAPEKAQKTAEQKTPKTKAKIEEKIEKAAPPKKARVRSKRYLTLRQNIDRAKAYSPQEAIKLLLQLANAGFDETVELNLTTKKERLSGAVKLPHGTGKAQKIVVFDDKVEARIKAGKLDFDLLIAKPADMAKITRYAQLLGPKGLMPNPKSGTISETPEATVKKLKQEVHFKTEKKTPLVHAVIGKVSFGEKKLLENFEALLAAVNTQQISKVSIASSMGPGIKVAI